MTLATTCPVCQTSFKVIPDQLKLRRGLVRCGSCHTVFSGIDHLRHINDELGQPQAPEQESPGDAEAAGDTGEADQNLPEPTPESGPAQPDEDLAEFIAESEAEPLEDAISELIAASESGREDEPDAEMIAGSEPAPRDQDLDATSVAGNPESPFAELITSEALADPEPEQPAPAPADPEIPAFMQAPQEDAIDFFSESAQRRIRWWPRSAFGKAFALVLLAVLPVQLALALRSEIVARFPTARPALEALAQPLGMTVELPRNPRKITIEIDLSIGESAGTYRINALLRSLSDTPLQWPAIEISLTDANGATVVRRVLMPADYLAGRAAVAAGLPGRSEQNLRVDFMLRDVVLTGYSAVLFYP